MPRHPSHPSHPSRRSALAALLAACSLPAVAQGPAAWPGKSVRLIVPFPPGTAPDVVGRLLGERLQRTWGQAVVVENRPGAGGIPGMVALAKSGADGYTFGLVPAAAATITPLLYKNPQYSLDKDVVPVAPVATGPMMIVVNAASNIRSFADLVAQGKSQPGKLNFAAAQPNSLPHLTGEMLNKTLGMGLYTVPYPGSQAAVTAVLAGDVTMTIDGLPGLVPHVKAGKLRALAVTSDKRLPGFEDVPALSETVKNFESIGWFGVFAPTGTPAAVIDQFNRDVNKALADPELVARYAEMGIYPKPGSTGALKDFVAQQQALFHGWIDTLGLQPQ